MSSLRAQSRNRDSTPPQPQTQDFKGSDSEGEKAEDGGLASLGGLEAPLSLLRNGVLIYICMCVCVFLFFACFQGSGFCGAGVPLRFDGQGFRFKV